MAKPTFTYKKIRLLDDRKVRQLQVAFKNPKKTILILDNYFGLENEIPQNTFGNLCYEVCATLKSSHTFFYVETAGLDGQNIRHLISKIKPDGILFANSQPFKKLNLEVLDYFAFVRKFEGIPAILTPNFDKWTSGEGFEKGEAGKNLIGFNLKHLLAVSSGENPFPKITKEELTFPIRVIRTIEKFDKFMDILWEKKVVCIDVEGRGLEKIQNILYTIQFGFKTKQGIHTYVLPWKQKNHTWTDKELAYIYKRLKEYFFKTEAELVFHFAPYDVGQLCVILDMEFFPANVYDTIAGQFALDENHKFLDGLYVIGKDKYSPYSLGMMEYGYGIKRPDNILAKSDRSNMSRFSLQELADYGAWDVVTPLLIRDRQICQATDKYIGYKKRSHFHRLVIHQLGVMVKTFAMLMNTGIYIDLDNARNLVKKDSVFTTMADRIKKEILATKAGQKANNILVKKAGMAVGGGMFSSTKAEVFSMTKPSHLKTLFFDVMKLEAVRTGKNGEPSTDKAFQKAYKHINEVMLFGRSNKVKTLKSNFADGIVKLSKTDKDFMADGRLRPFFGFTRVLPGRISVNKPNSQNIPTRSDKEWEEHKALVKSIKKSFSVKFGRVMLGSDFSAHEIRVAGIVSGDPEIKKVFLIANEAIRKYRLSAVDVLQKATEILAREGDIHIQNVLFFFKQTVDKKHVLRDQIKQVVFGVLYGKMARALAKELGIEVKAAQALIDILFEKWNVLGSWIDDIHTEGKETYMIQYPNKRIRHLWAYLNDDIWVHHAMDRRGVNSPLQGFASDIGIVAVYCFKQWVHENITLRKKVFDAHHTNIVHDAQYSDILYEHLPLAVYLTEHSMSTLPMNYYKEKFEYELSIPLSYGMEFGANWSALNEWNFRPETLLDLVKAEGQRMEKSGKQVDRVIEDTKRILTIRTKELEKNPYKMLVTSDNIEERLFDKMYMFKRAA